MLDFAAVAAKTTTFSDLAASLSVRDLEDLTNEMIDAQLAIIADATDADVTFVPSDPVANDTFAAPGTDVQLAWTLGHVVVHVTASSEESAALALSLARGIPVEGRSRYETDWESVTTIAQVRDRLHESRRMRLAMVAAFPAQPHLETTTTLSYAGTITCFGRFILGLAHDTSHLDQLREIMRQTRAARVS